MASSEKITREQVIAPNVFTDPTAEARVFLAVLNDVVAAVKQTVDSTSKEIPIASPQNAEDVKKLAATIAKLEKQIKALTVVKEKQKKIAKEIRVENEKDNIERKKARQTAKDQAVQESKLTSTYEKQVNELARLKRGLKDLAVQGKLTSAEGKKMTAQFRELDTSVREAEQAVGENQRSVGNYGSALSGLGGAAGGAVGGIKALSAQLLSLLANPVALAIVAIVAAVYALGKAFMSTDSGGTEFLVRMEQVGAVLDNIRLRAVALVDAIIDLHMNDAASASENFSKALSTNTDEFNKAVDAARVYIEALDSLEDRESDYLVQKSKNELEIAKLESQAVDRSVSAKVREEGLKEALRLGEVEVKQAQAFVKERLDAELNYLAAKNNVTKAELDAYIDATEEEKKLFNSRVLAARNANEEEFKNANDLRAKMIDLERQFYEESKRNISKLSGLRKELEAERQKIEDDAQSVRDADRLREIALIEDDRKKAIAAEVFRYDKELRSAKKSKEDLLLVLRIFNKNVIEINTDFNNKERIRFDKQVAEDKKREAKRLADLRAALSEDEAIIQNSIDRHELQLLKQNKTEKDIRRTLTIDRIEALKEIIKLEKAAADLNIDTTAKEIELQKLLNGLQKEADDDQAKINKQRLDEQRNFQNLLIKGVADGVKKRSEIEQDAINKELDASAKAVQKQEDLAAKGLENTLAFQEKKQEELQVKLAREQEAERRREEAIQLSSAFLGSYNSRLDKNQSTTAALAGALSDTLIAKALSASIAGAFAGGVEDFQGKGTGTSDSNLIAFSHGESVVTAKATEKYSGLVTAMNNGLVDDYVKQMILPDMDARPSNNSGSFQSAAIVYTLTKEMSELRKEIKNKRETNINWDAQGARVEEVVENGMRKVTKHITTGKRRL